MRDCYRHHPLNHFGIHRGGIVDCAGPPVVPNENGTPAPESIDNSEHILAKLQAAEQTREALLQRSARDIGAPTHSQRIVVIICR